MRLPAVLSLALILAFCLAPAAAFANETDQFTLPAGREFVDLGAYFSRETYDVLAKVVRETNARIDEARRDADAGKLGRLQSPQYVARAVYDEYGLGVLYADQLETKLESAEMQARYPGKIVAYRTPKSIFVGGYLPVDPRRLAAIALGSTVKVYGIYFGTDKLGHFHHLGYEYYKKTVDRDAPTREEAAAHAINSFAHGPVSESTVLGVLSAGVFANGDLAANYVGMKFYFNLTEPVRLKGQMYPPMLVRQGERWALNQHVTPDAPIFEPFVSEHYNEALNPSVYSPGLRGHVAKVVRRQAGNILAFYADEHGQTRSPLYFDDKVQELWTYYGEDYGHSRSHKNLVTIGHECFDDQTRAAWARAPRTTPVVRASEAAKPG